MPMILVINGDCCYAEFDVALSTELEYKRKTEQEHICLVGLDAATVNSLRKTRWC